MSKIVRVTLEFDDVVKIADGKEATRFEENLHELVVYAHENDLDPFNGNPIHWNEFVKKKKK